MGLLEEDADPLVLRVRPHEEGVSTVSLVAWWYTSIDYSSRVVSVPHRIDTISKEQRLLCALAQSHYSLIVSSLVSSECLHAHPVKIRVVDYIVNFEVGGS